MDPRSPLLRVSLSLQNVSLLPSAGSGDVLYTAANDNPVKGDKCAPKEAAAALPAFC